MVNRLLSKISILVEDRGWNEMMFGVPFPPNAFCDSVKYQNPCLKKEFVAFPNWNQKVDLFIFFFLNRGEI